MPAEKPTRWFKGHWIQRVRTGKINLYVRKTGGPSQNGLGSTPFTDYYYHEKKAGEFILSNYENLSIALKDNAEALKELQRLYPKKRINFDHIQANAIDLSNIIDLYNRL